MENIEVQKLTGPHPHNRLVEELPITLSSGYEEKLDMPDLRKEKKKREELSSCSGESKEDVPVGSVGRWPVFPPKKKSSPELKEEWWKTACALSGFAEKTEKSDSSRPLPSLLEKYKKYPEGTIQKEWANKAEKNELTSSGMPAYLDGLIAGKDDYELETQKFCKLAGLKYKTSKQKMQEQIADIQKTLNDTMQSISKKLQIIVKEYKQIEEA